MFEQICSRVAKSGPFYLTTALCHVSWTHNWLSDIGQADFLCRDDAFHSWFLSVFFPLWIYWHVPRQQRGKDQPISCSPALLKCQSKRAVFTFTIILLIDLRSISFGHWCLITLTLISQRPSADLWLMRKSHFWCHALIKHTEMC